MIAAKTMGANVMSPGRRSAIAARGARFRAARRYLAAISKCLAQSNKSHTGVPATNSSQISQQG